MKIYADILFSVNFFMDLFVFYATSVILRCKAGIKKIAVVSALCAFLCTTVILLFLQSILLMLSSAAAILCFAVKVLFKPPSAKSFLNCCVAVICVSFFAAGIFTWIYGYSNIFWFIHNDFLLTATIFVISLLTLWGIFFLWNKKMRMLAAEQADFVKCVAERNGKKEEINLFIDSGCMLTENSEGRTVFIVQLTDIMNLLTEEETYKILDKECTEEFEKAEILTATGKGFFKCIKCRAVFENGDLAKSADVLIAVSVKPLFSDNGCEGIIGKNALKNVLGRA